MHFICFSEDKDGACIRVSQELLHSGPQPVKGLEPGVRPEDQEGEYKLDSQTPEHWSPPHLKRDGQHKYRFMFNGKIPKHMSPVHLELESDTHLMIIATNKLQLKQYNCKSTGLSSPSKERTLVSFSPSRKRIYYIERAYNWAHL